MTTANGSGLDEILEECSRRRLGVQATLERFLPAACRALGACAAAVHTQDESLARRGFSWGAVQAARHHVRVPLDVSGRSIGEAAFHFADAPADRRAAEASARAVCEQLDGHLFALQTAAFKQKLVEDIGRSLTRHVFDQAVDDAVEALHAATGFESFALVYLDDEDGGGDHVRYRVYRGSRCVASSGHKRLPAVEALVRRRGASVLEPGSPLVAEALGFSSPVAASLIAGVAQPRPIGQAVVQSKRGLDVLGRDLLQIFANAVTQRLVDYSRERRHLAQFFGPIVIDELVGERGYAKRLAPRVETIGVLYADINSFTKICERALKRPDRIGKFVDHWSAGAVDLVWKNGGVFDKMVGDCIIAHYGPPFYRSSAAERARAAVKTAFEIQEFTKRLQQDREFAPLAKAAGLPGLGVAIGVNLCPAAVGLFGPNRDFTAFSRGMNETARLQSHAGFRQTLGMEPVAKALKGARGVRVDGPHEAAVKNVGKPLLYYKLSPA